MENPRTCSVCLVEPNKYEAQITVDLLRSAGFEKITVCPNADDAMERLKLVQTRLVFLTLDHPAFDARKWVHRFRCDRTNASRKSPVFVLTKALTRATAEQSRLIGANAIVGKPTSLTALSSAIKQVMENPRPFIEGPNYVGPCRRAGIVTVHAPKRRRSDAPSREPAPASELAKAVILALHSDVKRLMAGDLANVGACKTLLASGATTVDGPLTRVSAAMVALLEAGQAPDAARRAAIESCMTAAQKIALLDPGRSAEREALAQGAEALIAVRRAA